MSGTVIAITGATGYVGGVMAEALARDFDVVPLVRAPRGAGDLRWSFESNRSDLADELRRRGVGRVLHAAWDMNSSSLDEQRRTSVAGSRALLQAAKEAGAGFTFVSTISAFAGARSSYGRAKLEVEESTLAACGTVLRLGLVYGDAGERGVFGGLRATVRRAKFVPLIGRGDAPQYLLHENTLADVARRSADGVWDGFGRPITVAAPEPIPFRDLLRRIAHEEGRDPVLVPVPSPLLYAGLRLAEALGIRTGFRSDSVTSFVHQDSSPDFGAMRELGIEPRQLD